MEWILFFKVAHNGQAFVLLGFRIPTLCLAVTFFITAKLLQLNRITNAERRYFLSPNSTNALVGCIRL